MPERNTKTPDKAENIGSRRGAERNADERPGVTCLDLEGVLMPEVWISLAEQFGVPALRLTTRDISDYDELMQHRLGELRKHRIGLSDIRRMIAGLRPLEGGADFLRQLRRETQVIILSDTFLQFWEGMAGQLDYPTIFCNSLIIRDDHIVDYRMRVDDGKRKSVESLRSLGFHTTAVGDSFNDISMLRAADRGILFRPSSTVVDAHGDLPVVMGYGDLFTAVREPRD